MQKKSSKRFKEIVGVLTRYGFEYLTDNRNNRRLRSPSNLRKAFEELGPTFIKIGQILSSRADILPTEYIKELSKLQDDVSPERYEDINSVFFNEFTRTIEDSFLKFDKKPLASASIAQVHSATLKDGREVIVKIQRPFIKEKMKTDISILYKIVKLTKNKFSDSIIDPEEALNELLSSTEQELDFKSESKNIKKFKELNKNVAFSYVPYVIDELSSSKVITMEKIEGFKINDLNKLKKGGYDLHDLGTKLTLSFFKQVFTDGFFHADPHPGNLLITGGTICFLDFGIMGTLSESLKTSLNEAIIAIAYQDLDKLVSVIMSIGIKKGLVNRNRLYEDVDNILSNYLSTSLKNIKISVLISEVFDCAKNNNIKLPQDLTLLVKSLIIIEGVVAKIAPDIQILDVAIPFVKSSSKFYFLDNLSFEDTLITSYNFTRNSLKIPTKVIELINSFLNGRASLQLRFSTIDKSIGELNKMANRLVLSLVMSSMLISSSLILNSNIGPKVCNISLIGGTVFVIAIIMSFILIVSIVKSGKL